MRNILQTLRVNAFVRCVTEISEIFLTSSVELMMLQMYLQDKLMSTNYCLVFLKKMIDLGNITCCGVSGI